MITDGAKFAAKDAFKGALMQIVGAVVVYLAIKGWQRYH